MYKYIPNTFKHKFRSPAHLQRFAIISELVLTQFVIFIFTNIFNKSVAISLIMNIPISLIYSQNCYSVNVLVYIIAAWSFLIKNYLLLQHSKLVECIPAMVGFLNFSILSIWDHLEIRNNRIFWYFIIAVR